MKSSRSSLAALAACGLLFSAAAAFAAPKDYQITGNVTSMTDSTIVITTTKKDKTENWEIGRDASTKAADVKVGDHVTVHYSMMASSVEANANGGKDKKPTGDKVKNSSPAAETAAPKP